MARDSSESTSQPPNVRRSRASFHLSQSPTVVSMPPGPTTFSNGISRAQAFPLMRVRLRATGHDPLEVVAPARLRHAQGLNSR